MTDLRATIIQATLHWEDREANTEMFGQKLAGISEDTDLIILPEMFNTGFSMKPEKLYEEVDGPTVQWMAAQAKQRNAVVMGSLIIRDNGSYYNRLIWMRPDGTWRKYDKRHLFSYAGEHEHYAPGKERWVEAIKGWKIYPQVCYDLRFPVWNRNDLGYDVVIFIANWPERRSYPWKQLLIARAIENQGYVIGVNRVGEDGNGIYHSGDSGLVDPLGEVVMSRANEEFVKTVTLKREWLLEVRERYRFLADRDDFKIKNME